MREFHNNIDV